MEDRPNARSSPRHKVRFPVTCEAGGQTVEVQAGNISRGGIMLISAQSLKVGTMARLVFDLESRGKIEVRGMVRHSVMEKSCGVEFVEIQAADQQRLADYLASAPESADESKAGVRLDGASAATP